MGFGMGFPKVTAALIFFSTVFASFLEQTFGQHTVGEAGYYAYVNWDYRHRNDLVGWKHTSELIQGSLKQWGYSLQTTKVENTDLSELQQFQKEVVSQPPKRLKLIYLASHQTPSGRIDFPNEAKDFWSEGFAANNTVPDHPSILILDTCYSDVIPQTRMNENIPFRY